MDRTPDTPAQRHLAPDAPRAARRVGAAVVAMLVAAAVFAGPVDAQATRPGEPVGAESEFLHLLNQERAKAGLGALQSHPNLVRDARAWSEVMAQQDRLFHTSTLAADTGRSISGWTRAGENVGRGWSIGRLHDAFVASPGHYRNIVGDFNYVGIGVVYTSQRTWVTFRFAKGPASAAVASTSVQAPVSYSVATGQVRRLYLAFFKREPDAAGSTFWVTKVTGGYPLGGIADEFVRSAEFRSTYGHLSNGQFVHLVYQNVLGRAPDAAGYDYWIQQMSRGMGRGSVMVNFSESAEFKAKTA
jgi:uncharacterized protein YkwD